MHRSGNSVGEFHPIWRTCKRSSCATSPPGEQTGKDTNPVGTFYHPETIAEARWTDSEGRSTLKKVGPDDSYDLVITSSVPLTVVVGVNIVFLDPGTNTNLSALHYNVERQGEEWKITVAKPGWNWTKYKPNKRRHGTR